MKVASRIIWNVIHYFLINFLENMVMTALEEGTDMNKNQIDFSQG